MQCYRHPDRETRVSCSRCDRPICGDCMTPSPVGMRCPECSGGDGTTQVRRPAFAGEASGFDRAPATFTLIGINVAVFVFQIATGGGLMSNLGGPLIENGALCANAVGGGGPCTPPLIETAGGELWRILSSGFLHGNFLHIALNMFVLYILGTMLEPVIGARRMVAIYFVSLIGGSLGAMLLAEPFQNTVGASGAIYGLFAAALMVARNRGMDHVVSQLGFWLVLNVVFTFSVSGISIGGHLGGLAAGAIAGGVVLAGERRGGPEPVRAEVAALVALAVAVFVGAVVVANSASGNPLG
jgi:membrane associated rhomboid family serine protease